ncbi:rod shape-determining protein MreC [Patescibacteria group bacterium]|nr:rod shape-determining protein MreC [Patescibacteria group bacterium]
MKKFSSTTKASSRRSFFSERRHRLTLIFLGLVLAAGFLLPTLMGVVSDIAMAPFVRVASWVRESPGMIPTYLRERSALRAEIEELRAQIDSSTAHTLTINRLTEENIALRSVYGEGLPSKRLLSRVVARPPWLAYDLIQIDKGADDGVVVGSPVFAGRDVVIGSVVETSARHAFVELVTTAGFQSTVYIPAAKLVATMEGQGSGVSRVRFAQGIRVMPGDLVVMLAYDAGVYGQVSHVENASTQPEQYAYVTLPEAIQSLRYVTVGEKPDAPPAAEVIASSTQALLASYFYIPAVAEFLVPSSTPTSTDVLPESELTPL